MPNDWNKRDHKYLHSVVDVAVKLNSQAKGTLEGFLAEEIDEMKSWLMWRIDKEWDHGTRATEDFDGAVFMLAWYALGRG